MPTPEYLLKQVHIDENENISLSNVQWLLYNNFFIPNQLPDISELEQFIVKYNNKLPDEDDIINNILTYGKQDKTEALAVNDAYWYQFINNLSETIEQYYNDNKNNYINNAIESFFNKHSKLNDKDKNDLLIVFNEEKIESNYNYHTIFKLTNDFNYKGSYIWLNGKNIHSQMEIDDVIQDKINELVFNEFDLIADIDLNINLNEKKSIKP